MNNAPPWVMLSVIRYQDHDFDGVAALWCEAFPNDISFRLWHSSHDRRSCRKLQM